LLNDHYLLIKYSRILVAVSIIFFLVALISIVILRQKKKIRLKEKELLESIKLSDKLKEKNAELSHQKRQAEEIILKTDLEIKETALASKLLSLSQIHEFLTTIKQKISVKENTILNNETISFFKELELIITNQQKITTWKNLSYCTLRETVVLFII